MTHNQICNFPKGECLNTVVMWVRTTEGGALQETVIADGKVSGQEIKMAGKHQAGRQWMGLCYG